MSHLRKTGTRNHSRWTSRRARHSIRDASLHSLPKPLNPTTTLNVWRHLWMVPNVAEGKLFIITHCIGRDNLFWLLFETNFTVVSIGRMCTLIEFKIKIYWPEYMASIVITFRKSIWNIVRLPHSVTESYKIKWTDQNLAYLQSHNELNSISINPHFTHLYIILTFNFKMQIYCTLCIWI